MKTQSVFPISPGMRLSFYVPRLIGSIACSQVENNSSMSLNFHCSQVSPGKCRFSPAVAVERMRNIPARGEGRREGLEARDDVL